MFKTVIAVVAVGLVLATTAYAANPVRISIVYGGGGNSGAYWRNDFVELFNSSDVAVDIGNWAVLYATSANTSFGSASNYRVVIPAGSTIPACGYYLVQCAAGANTGAQPLPAPDAAGNIAMSATACKIGLVSSGITGSCATPFVDLVAVGASSGCWEGAGPTAGTSNTTAAVRKMGGMLDTDNNSSDFVVLAADASLVIHNSLSPANSLCAVPTFSNTWGAVKAIYR